MDHEAQRARTGCGPRASRRELEKDTSGEKKPSAEILLRIANVLSVTIADLLDLPTVQLRETAVELSGSLQEFRDRMKRQRTPLVVSKICTTSH